MGMYTVSSCSLFQFARGLRRTTVEGLLLGWFLLVQVTIAGTYYPPPESKGGWRTLVTKNAVPTADQKSAVLNAVGSYANPFQDVHVTATFTHATGKPIRVDGFHDGGSVWKIRFMPTDLGKWTYVTSSPDAGLNGETGTLDCVAPTKPYLHGPLKVQGYHFVHADGTPRFLISTRPTFWTAATAGAYSMWGSLSVYETGDPLAKMKVSATPAYLRVLHDVMADLPYRKMEPQNEIVTPADVTLDGEARRTNFALAQPGEVYLIYSLHGGTGAVTLAPGQYSAVRIDPRDGTRTELGEVAGGAIGFSLPQGDWVLVYRRTAGGDRIA